MNKILILLIVCWSCISSGYSISIYDSETKDNHVVIELVDDCDYSHKLLISFGNVLSQTTDDWIDLLLVSGEWNKCKNNAKSS